jgi:serine-type D-Ala-D-Ala carboxypeptidase (penicillin-binding protein 5/6)
MTRILRTSIPMLLSLMLVLVNQVGTASAQEVPGLMINSERYIVIDAETGHVFAQRGAHDQVAIASLTKVFTAVQALNMAPLDTPITTKEFDLAHPEATAMGFGPGETYTLEDMLYGMMLPSGNDAAYSVARTLGYREGDTDEEAVQHFMDLVNQRVQNMGLENTYLLNPDGWGVPGHYSSAADVAAFMQYAMEYPFLVQVMGTLTYTTSNGLMTLANSNKMLNTYAPLVGGKTGYDWDSGWCLVNLAEDGGARMIAVTLDGIAPDDWYDDNAVLLRYGFEQRRALASSGEAFTGEALSWQYPDAAELASVGTARGSVAGSLVSDQDMTSGEDGRGAPRATSADQTFQAAGPLLAGLSAALIVGLSGALHWRNGGGRFTIPSGRRPGLFRRA